MTALDLGCGLGHFSLGMARLVGARGRVAAVDLQQGALDVVTRRAERAGLAGVLSTHRCEAGTLGELPRADFVLAFWMVHETPDVGAFFRQVAALLHPGGRLLFAEPPLHVSRGAFEEEVRLAQGAGLTLEARPRMALCRAALLRLDGRGNEGMDEGMDVRSNEAERVARDPG
jgi:SAM-dependent methyltransferase